VLFICSGARGISPIVSAQAQSLVQCGAEVIIQPISGHGIAGYLRAVPNIRKQIKNLQPNTIHAHYSLCGIVASMATGKRVITSLMGSDVKQSGFFRFVIKYFVKYIWGATIVKSLDMKESLGIDEVNIIPNGVDLDLFRPLNKQECLQRLNWDSSKKHILFVSASSADRPEKNLKLARLSVEKCGEIGTELHVLSNITQSEMPVYLNASDLLLLTSKWEGSPNIVKEAMACNVPVVSTDVGDVKWLFGKVEGYMIAESAPETVADAIKKTIGFINTGGRSRIIELQLDSHSVAQKLIRLYEEVGSA
jgi:glycosyltransferase involved in cell wall biosynthesis